MLNQKEKRILREESYIEVVEKLDENGKLGKLEIVGRGRKGLVFVAHRGKEKETFVVMRLVAKKGQYDGFEDVAQYEEKMREKEEADKE